jgi:hypothetical protein
MQVNRDEVLSYLKKLEEKNGGFYGTDLMNFVMVSWIYNTANNAKSVFMHFSEVMLHGLSLCVHCQIDHYTKEYFKTGQQHHNDDLCASVKKICSVQVLLL